MTFVSSVTVSFLLTADSQVYGELMKYVWRFISAHNNFLLPHTHMTYYSPPELPR